MRRAVVAILLLMPCHAQSQAWLAGLTGAFQGMAQQQEIEQKKALADQQIASLRQQAEYYRARQVIDSVNAINERARQIQAGQEMADRQWKVFFPRARYVIQHAVDSLPVFHAAILAYADTAAKALLELYVLTPDATNATMLDVVAPAADSYRKRANAAIETGRAVITRLEDSLRIKPKDHDAFWSATGLRAYAVTGENISASPAELRRVLQPVIDSIGLTRMLDSARRAPKKKPPV